MEQQQIRIAVNGVVGRMGKAISRMAENHPNLSIVHAYDSPDSSSITTRLCEITKTQLQVVIESSKSMNEGDFDVLVDFSTPLSVMDAARCCLHKQRPMVIGVTGFDNEQKEELHTLAKELPILMSPNMSIGVNLCFKLLRQIAQEPWSQNARVDIIETHHKEKKDKPSGTALRMSEIIAEAKGIDLSEISIESYREGEIMGEHRVFFSVNRERIELRHEAMDRTSFADGALYAAGWLAEKRPSPGRIYTMDDVIVAV